MVDCAAEETLRSGEMLEAQNAARASISVSQECETSKATATTYHTEIKQTLIKKRSQLQLEQNLRENQKALFEHVQSNLVALIRSINQAMQFVVELDSSVSDEIMFAQISTDLTKHSLSHNNFEVMVPVLASFA